MLIVQSIMQLLWLMQLISQFNKGIRFLLCVIDLFSNYACVAPLKDKKGITIISAFQKALTLF